MPAGILPHYNHGAKTPLFSLIEYRKTLEALRELIKTGEAWNKDGTGSVAPTIQDEDDLMLFFFNSNVSAE
jgi:hypothetical protein